MYYNNRDIRLEEMPVPIIGHDEILMRIEASGICGSDVLEWYRINKAPLVLGHEVAGTVAEIGKGITRYKIGERIAASHHVPCFTCHYCMSGHETVCDTLRSTNFYPGGFAEYVRLPAINVDRGIYRLPEGVDFEEGTFAEPLACVIRGQRVARFEPGVSVLILGAGISGLLHIALARATGAGRIFATDTNEYRRKAALRFGADAVFDASDDIAARLKEMNGGRLAERVIICTGAMKAMQQAFSSVERGGIVLFFASAKPGETIPLNIERTFWRTDITLTTSYAGSPGDHVRAIELIRFGVVPVKEMITHRFPLADTQKGFELVTEAKESIKVIIKPQE
jgi:L-iditol 2-dehydrogenase